MYLDHACLRKEQEGFDSPPQAYGINLLFNLKILIMKKWILKCYASEARRQLGMELGFPFCCENHNEDFAPIFCTHYATGVANGMRVRYKNPVVEVYEVVDGVEKLIQVRR